MYQLAVGRVLRASRTIPGHCLLCTDRPKIPRPEELLAVGSPLQGLLEPARSSANRLLAALGSPVRLDRNDSRAGMTKPAGPRVVTHVVPAVAQEDILRYVNMILKQAGTKVDWCCAFM